MTVNFAPWEGRLVVDFKLSDEQQQYQQLARDFAQKEIAARAATFDQQGEFPAEIIEMAWDLGLMNSVLPEKFGGLGLHVFEACLIAEELAAACPAVALSIEANNLAIAAVSARGSDEQQEKLLSNLAANFALAGYSACETPLKAARSKDEWVLTGRLRWVVNAGHAQWFYCLAETQGNLSAFIVAADSKGVKVAQQEARMGLRAADMAMVDFEEVKLPSAGMLGKEGEGRAIQQLIANKVRPLQASVSVGMARSAMEHSIRYAKERTTFGTAIANHQAVSFMIADMAKDIQAARLLAWQAAWLHDHGHDNAQEAAIASSFAADTAIRVGTDAVQVFGGYGYSREYPVEKVMRDAKVMQVLHGTSHREKVAIARQLAGISQ